MRTASIAVLIVLSIASLDVADGEESCLYIDSSNFIRQVARLDDIPREYRSKAKCSSEQQAKSSEIAEPRDVQLMGSVRSASFATDLGRMEVRWQRKAEECFGKNPDKAVASAAQTVNRAIKSARFSTAAKHPRRDWQIVFIDRAAAFAQFPASISVGGHPGFMVPPSNIYIISDFIPGSCSGNPVADSVLEQVLLHEMGHVIEYTLLEGSKASPDRARSEGFASWFEQYSAEYARDIPDGEVTAYYNRLARQGLSDKGNLAVFDGSAQAYAVSALRFRAIVDRKGVSGLMRVYDAMSEQSLSFDAAVKETLRWNEGTMQREMARIVR